MKTCQSLLGLGGLSGGFCGNAAKMPGDKRDEIRRDLCNGIDPAVNRLETHVFPYVGQTSAARIAGADPLAVLRRVEPRGHLRAGSSRALHLQPRVEICARRRAAVPDVAADLIPLLVPGEVEPMAAVIA
jgi:hypothetical protein